MYFCIIKKKKTYLFNEIKFLVTQIFNEMKKVFLFIICGLMLAASAQAQNNLDILWAKNFGGIDDDYYNSVITLSDGIVAVGYSYPSSFNSSDWAGIVGKGGQDAIIVKYDFNGNIVWKKNFGGSDFDKYNSVTKVSDGIVAVGYSYHSSFNSGDWAGIAGKGNDDAIIVKYDFAGNVVWKNNFGGSGYDVYNSVTTVSDGIVAVGYSGGFGSGDLSGLTGKGLNDAIIVKYDNNGDVVWKQNFGGSDRDHYGSVTTVSDGIVAVGCSEGGFGNGDLSGLTGKGGQDAIIVKYDNSGTVVWKNNFGGIIIDYYNSVSAVSDGIVAVGYSQGGFGSGDLSGLTGKGLNDAIIVKYDNNGDVVWKQNFGGSDYDYYSSVTTVSDGIVAVGYSQGGFGSGDLSGLTGKGGQDAIIVKYDNSGTIVWKKDFGGSSHDRYNSVTTVSDGIVAVGYSNGGFGSGDLSGLTGKGGIDAISVKYFLSVTNITNIPATAYVNIPLTLSGTIEPSNVTNPIEWSIVNAGTTGAIISNGNILNATSYGTVTVRATILNGIGTGTNYTKDFEIDVLIVPVTNITNLPTTAFIGTSLILNGNVQPSNATYQTIEWSIVNAGTTGAIIIGNSLFAVTNGIVIIQATINNGTAIGTDYTQGFYVAVNEPFIAVTNIANLPNTATAGTPLTLSGNVQPNNATYQTIEWSIEDAENTGATINNNIFNATTNGIATVRATITNGTDIGTDYVQTFFITVGNIGIENYNCEEESIIVYPNPTNRQLTISNYELGIKDNNIKIYDIIGHCVAQFLIDNSKFLIELNISHLQSGMYYLQVGNEIVKIIKN